MFSISIIVQSSDRSGWSCYCANAINIMTNSLPSLSVCLPVCLSVCLSVCVLYAHACINERCMHACIWHCEHDMFLCGDLNPVYKSSYIKFHWLIDAYMYTNDAL